MQKPVKFFGYRQKDGSFYAATKDNSIEVIAQTKPQLIERCMAVVRMGQKHFIPVVIDFTEETVQ